jgi:CheY-like chemotaxis protein
MNLEYRILWFEDIKSSFDAKKEIVRDIVEDLGFKFPDPQNEINGDNIETINYEEFDLMIVDLRLAGTTGTNLINRIRQNEGIFTEVIFYSSEGEKAVRDALKEYEIDGAYCADRNNEDFEEKVRKVISTTIKKVQDLNNMRGLVMAEVSDFDEKMVLIIQKYIKKIEADKGNEFLDKRKAKVIYSLDAKKKDISGTDLSKLVQNWNFDSSHKWRTVKDIVNGLNDLNIKECIEKYDSEISQKRNKLAHVKETKDENGNKILTYSDFIFNDDTCRQIRMDLKKHSSNFEKIDDLLTKL